MVALLAGGTGGAKLARGMLDVVGPAELAVIANTADDVEVYGVHVSPDPDLVTYWLADLIDERGWGIAGDTWETMAALEAKGEPAWFRLGDRDLELCRLRTERMRAGARLTEAHQAVAEAVGVQGRVLPMSDEPVRTHVRSGGRWLPFQEFMVREQAAGPIEGLELRGAEEARPTPEVLEALASSEAVVIGPSNPVISIGPILAVPGVREAMSAMPAPVVAVSPFVHGRPVKGPTDAFCAFAGLPGGAQAVAAAYEGVADAALADEPLEGLPTREIDVLMQDAAGRRRVAEAALELAASLAGR